MEEKRPRTDLINFEKLTYHELIETVRLAQAELRDRGTITQASFPLCSRNLFRSCVLMVRVAVFTFGWKFISSRSISFSSMMTRTSFSVSP